MLSLTKALFLIGLAKGHCRDTIKMCTMQYTLELYLVMEHTVLPSSFPFRCHLQRAAKDSDIGSQRWFEWVKISSMVATSTI